MPAGGGVGRVRVPTLTRPPPPARGHVLDDFLKNVRFYARGRGGPVVLGLYMEVNECTLDYYAKHLKSMIRERDHCSRESSLRELHDSKAYNQRASGHGQDTDETGSALGGAAESGGAQRGMRVSLQMDIEDEGKVIVGEALLHGIGSVLRRELHGKQLDPGLVVVHNILISRSGQTFYPYRAEGLDLPQYIQDLRTAAPWDEKMMEPVAASIPASKRGTRISSTSAAGPSSVTKRSMETRASPATKRTGQTKSTSATKPTASKRASPAMNQTVDTRGSSASKQTVQQGTAVQEEEDEIMKGPLPDADAQSAQGAGPSVPQTAPETAEQQDDDVVLLSARMARSSVSGERSGTQGTPTRSKTYRRIRQKVPKVNLNQYRMVVVTVDITLVDTPPNLLRGVSKRHVEALVKSMEERGILQSMGSPVVALQDATTGERDTDKGRLTKKCFIVDGLHRLKAIQYLAATGAPKWKRLAKFWRCNLLIRRDGRPIGMKELLCVASYLNESTSTMRRMMFADKIHSIVSVVAILIEDVEGVTPADVDPAEVTEVLKESQLIGTVQERQYLRYANVALQLMSREGMLAHFEDICETVSDIGLTHLSHTPLYVLDAEEFSFILDCLQMFLLKGKSTKTKQWKSFEEVRGFFYDRAVSLFRAARAVRNELNEEESMEVFLKREVSLSAPSNEDDVEDPDNNAAVYQFLLGQVNCHDFRSESIADDAQGNSAPAPVKQSVTKRRTPAAAAATSASEEGEPRRSARERAQVSYREIEHGRNRGAIEVLDSSEEEQRAPPRKKRRKTFTQQMRSTLNSMTPDDLMSQLNEHVLRGRSMKVQFVALGEGANAENAGSSAFVDDEELLSVTVPRVVTVEKDAAPDDQQETGGGSFDDELPTALPESEEHGLVRGDPYDGPLNPSWCGYARLRPQEWQGKNVIEHKDPWLRVIHLPKGHRSELLSVSNLRDVHHLVFWHAARAEHRLRAETFGMQYPRTRPTGMDDEEVLWVAAKEHDEFGQMFFARMQAELRQNGYCVLDGFATDNGVPKWEELEEVREFGDVSGKLVDFFENEYGAMPDIRKGEEQKSFVQIINDDEGWKDEGYALPDAVHRVRDFRPTFVNGDEEEEAEDELLSDKEGGAVDMDEDQVVVEIGVEADAGRTEVLESSSDDDLPIMRLRAPRSG
ncbi:mediator of RNA polymerase II transcription subunit 15-like isoform X1 [Gracilaria domingensis]|nr:mediator of RNA polymerase II transcription subunit 15-like isoform X1 [Gracilaria domingensis]